MKLKTLTLFLSTVLFGLSTHINAKEETQMSPYHTVTESTLIPMKAKSISGLTDLLKQGAKIVKQTEPNTKSWFALKEGDNTFYIFDVFSDAQGRIDHLNGKVAHAIKDHANELVQGGWQQGVVENIKNGRVLSAKLAKPHSNMAIANYISFKAKPGFENQIAQLLAGAAQLVDETEPKTTAWFAIQLSSSQFAIFDAFEDIKGQQAHFQGKVAAALHAKASTHIVGGWDNGVVANIKNLQVIAGQ